MRAVVVNSVLVVLLAALLVVHWVLTPDTTRRNIVVLPDMAASVPYDTFSPNPNFADHKTLREPVPGTVVRGYMPLHYAATPADALRAGQELVSPISNNDPRALSRGAVVYTNFCEPCHGPAGKGDGIVAQRGFPAPPSLLAPRARKLPDGQIFHILTFGQNTMPSYASQIERADRWAAIAWVRSLQLAAPVAMPAAPPLAVPAVVAKGGSGT